MMRTFLPAALMLLLTACGSGNANISAGTHNLSKGDCRNIQVCANGQCRTYDEKLPQAQCEMLGGEYSPPNTKRGWFF